MSEAKCIFRTAGLHVVSRCGRMQVWSCRERLENALRSTEGGVVRRYLVERHTITLYSLNSSTMLRDSLITLSLIPLHMK